MHPLMFLPHLYFNTRRITAWLLMLVCAWMGTAGVVNHTEAAARPGHKTASSLGRQVAVTADACAACEWTQGLQGRTLTVCWESFPLFCLTPRRTPAVSQFVARFLCHRPSRAPPSSAG